MSTFLQKAAFVGVASMGSMLSEGSYDPTLHDGVVAYVHPVSSGVKYAGASITAGGSRISLRQSLLSIDSASLTVQAQGEIHGLVDVSADATVTTTPTSAVPGSASVDAQATISSDAVTVKPASAEIIEGVGLIFSASGITGDGAGLVISIGDCVETDSVASHPSFAFSTGSTEVSATARNTIDASVDAVVSNATNLSVSGITADGAGVSLSSGTVTAQSEVSNVAESDIVGISTAVAINRNWSHGVAPITANSGTLGASGVTGDGAALILDNLTDITVAPTVSSVSYGGIDANSVSIAEATHNINISIPSIDGTADLNGASGVTGYCAGVYVSDVTSISVAPTVDVVGSAFIDVPAPSGVSNPEAASNLSGEGDISGADTTIVAPAITGDGAGAYITVGDLEATSTITIVGSGDVDANALLKGIARNYIPGSMPTINGSAVSIGASAAVNDGAGIFLTDVTELLVDATIEVAGTSDTTANANIGAISKSWISISSDVTTSGASSSVSAITGDGAGVVVSNAISVSAVPTSETLGAGDVTSNAFTESAPINTITLTSEVIDASGVNVSGSSIVGEGFGVFITEGELVGESKIIILGEVDTTYVNGADVTSEPVVEQNGISDITASGANASSSGITGDGAGVVVSDVTSISAEPTVTSKGEADSSVSSDVIAEGENDITLTSETITASGANASSAGIIGDGVSVFVSDVTSISAEPTSTKPTVADIDSVGATASSSSITGDGVGVFVSDVTTISVEPTVAHPSYGDMTSDGAAASGAGIIGDGVGVFVSDVTTISVESTVTNNGVAIVDSVAANASGSSIVGDGVGVFVSNVTNLEVEVSMNFACSAIINNYDDAGFNDIVTCDPTLYKAGTGSITSAGATASGSGVTGDGTAIMLSDVTTITAESIIEVSSVAPITANSVTDTQSYLDMSGGADRVNGINVIITAPAIVGYGVGVLVSDVTSITAEPTITLTGVATIDSVGASASGSSVNGNGAGIVLSNVTSITAEPTITLTSEATIDSVGASASGASNVGYAVGIFLSDVASVVAGASTTVYCDVPNINGTCKSTSYCEVTVSGEGDITSDAVTMSVSAISGDGAGVIVSNTNVVSGTAIANTSGEADVNVPAPSSASEPSPSIVQSGSADIASIGASVSGGSIIGNGFGLVLSDVTTVTAEPTITISAEGEVRSDAISTSVGTLTAAGEADMSVAGATGSVAANESQAAGVHLTDVTTVTAEAQIASPSFADVDSQNTLVTSDASIISNVEVSIDGISLVVSGSAITGDGSAIHMDIGEMTAFATMTFWMGVELPVNAVVEIETWPAIEAIWTAGGIDVVGADGTVIEAGTGVVVSEAVMMVALPDVIRPASADIDGLSTSSSGTATASTNNVSDGDIYSEGVVESESVLTSNVSTDINVTGDSTSTGISAISGEVDVTIDSATLAASEDVNYGAVIIISDVISIESIGTTESFSKGDVTASGAILTASSIVGDGASISITSGEVTADASITGSASVDIDSLSISGTDSVEVTAESVLTANTLSNINVTGESTTVGSTVNSGEVDVTIDSASVAAGDVVVVTYHIINEDGTTLVLEDGVTVVLTEQPA